MTNPNTYYQLVVLGHDGMYTHGELAATPELAKIAVGNLIRQPYKEEMRRLGIHRIERLPGVWADSSGNQHPRMGKAVLVEAESHPGEWAIGV